MCVCDISLILNMSVASTSHHLRLLYKNDVLDFWKDGKMAYYFIKDDEIKDFFCKNQFCPIFVWRKARKNALGLSLMMKYIKSR